MWLDCPVTVLAEWLLLLVVSLSLVSLVSPVLLIELPQDLCELVSLCILSKLLTHVLTDACVLLLSPSHARLCQRVLIMCVVCRRCHQLHRSALRTAQQCSSRESTVVTRCPIAVVQHEEQPPTPFLPLFSPYARTKLRTGRAAVSLRSRPVCTLSRCPFTTTARCLPARCVHALRRARDGLL